MVNGSGLSLAGLALALSLGASAPAQAAPLKAVAFDLELVDSSLEGSGGVPPERLKQASEQLRKILADSGQVTVLDTAPEAAAISKNLPLRNCHDCDLDIAKRLGADVEVTTALQRTSDVILGFSGSVRDVRTGRVLRSGLVDVRGNTDDLWRHGIRFLVKERLLDPPLPASGDALRALVEKAPDAPPQ